MINLFFLQDIISLEVGRYAKGYFMEKVKTLLCLNIEHDYVNFVNPVKENGLDITAYSIRKL